ncbi:MAG: hypothetical protein ACKOI2_04335 [Actinomycetota bacterium]
MGAFSKSTLIDDSWAIDDPSVAAGLHDTFVRDGVVVLPGFVPPDAVQQMEAECDRLAPKAFRSMSRSTPYLSSIRDDVPAGDPRGHEITSAVGVIAYDLVPKGDLVRQFYEDDGLLAFVAAVLGEPVLHRYADPFGALNISVMDDGDHLGWHFDMTDFVVSLAIRASERGGEFVNAPRIRHVDDENFPGVADVLAGRAPDRVRIEPMTPGTLMIFNGRWSMHKVSPVEGSRSRVVALLAYDRKPGTDSTDELKLSRYGRLPA